MPTYLFHNKTTDETFELFMSMSSREEFLKENPDIEQLVNGFPGINVITGSPMVHPMIRDRLKEIKKAHYKSNINTGNIGEI